MGFLGQKPLTRRTYAAPAGWSGGTFDQGSPTDSPIYGTWRPAPIAVLQDLPDGDRIRDPHVLYTQTALQTMSQHDATPADLVSSDGTVYYEVTDYGVHDASLAASPLAHRKYVCLRVQEADG